MRLERTLTSFGLILAAWTAFPAEERAASPESRAVVVDYSLASDTYRVVGDVELLSRRITPGSTIQLIIGAVALESGEIDEKTEITCRIKGGDSERSVPLTLAAALKDSNVDFFSQVARRSGYESIRRFLVRSDYTPSVPDAVASFADLARGEPLRVTVFEQNLFFQDLLRGSLPLAPETVRALEEWMKLDSDLSAWRTEGLGEVSSDPPRYVSWFNGVTRRKGGLHVVTVATLTDEPKALALDRFRRYLSGSRP